MRVLRIKVSAFRGEYSLSRGQLFSGGGGVFIITSYARSSCPSWRGVQ